MTIEELRIEIEAIKVKNSEDYYALDKVNLLSDEMREMADGHLLCSSMIRLLERHPEVDFGSPGERIHTIGKDKILNFLLTPTPPGNVPAPRRFFAVS